MRILVVEPYKCPIVQEIDGSLKSMQRIVGGNIEVIDSEAGPHSAIVCNEGFELDGLNPNRYISCKTVIRGVFFVCGYDDDGNLVDLPDESLRVSIERFSKPEIFVQQNYGLLAIPV